MFDAPLRAVFTQTLSQCQYAKDLERLLQENSGFYVHWNSESIRLEHYYQDLPDQAWPMQGICYELTYQLGRYLQQQAPPYYQFLAADGNCTQYYMDEQANHTFVVAVPKAACPIFPANGEPALLNAGYILDPSLKAHGLWHQDQPNQTDASVAGYHIKHVYPLNWLEPALDRCETFPWQYGSQGYAYTHTLPLGLSTDLLPPLALLPEAHLLVIGFQWEYQTSKPPQVLLGAKTAHETQPSLRPDIEAALPPEHLLTRFLARLRHDLASQPPQA